MTESQKLTMKRNRLAMLKNSPKNVKCPGVVRKLTREVRKLEQKNED